eukprot:3045139-Amphidinium_carterae.1
MLNSGAAGASVRSPTDFPNVAIDTKTAVTKVYRTLIQAGTWQRPSKAKEEPLAVDEALDALLTRAQADSDWARCQSTRRSTSCGMIWWGGVLITSYARTQSTIATSSAESEYYGVCACASDAVYVKELLKFIGEEIHIPLELDASSAISMDSRVGLGKARHVAVRYRDRWRQQLVADKTIKLQASEGLMEPESLAPHGYEVTDSTGVRDKLDRSKMVASIGIASLISGRELDIAAAHELTITTTNSNYFDGDVAVSLIGSILLVSITTIVIAARASMSWHQQQVKPQMSDASTQTDQCSATRLGQYSYDRLDAGPEDIVVYQQGRRYHTARECSAVTSAKSNPRQTEYCQRTRCRMCG